MTRKDHDRAYLQGVAARQAGKKQDRNPYAGKPALRPLFDAWLAGWQATDQLTRGK